MNHSTTTISLQPSAAVSAPAETSAHAIDETLVSGFERAAATYPSRIALGSTTWQPTYRELNETANRLAHRLIAIGGAPADRVAVLMEHDSPSIAAVLGILKAGRIVVALSPADPPARLKMLVEDAEPSIVVADMEHCKLAREIAGPGCRVISFESEIAEGIAQNPALAIPPEQTAFLVYTSGTTGRPKGVMQTHRQIRKNAAVHTEALQCTENDRFCHFAMMSTGQGVIVVWCALLNGAMLCQFPVMTKGVIGLADWLTARKISVYVSSASIFRTLMKTLDDGLVFSDVRTVRLASESVTADDISSFRRHFPPHSTLVHMLACSEFVTTAWSRWTQDDDIPEGTLPVGHFSSGQDVFLLGENDEPVARGEIGEIVVKTRYVAAGYWRDPQLTAARFSEVLDGRGTRLVRIGDQGRINADGLLEFCGRKDDRVKIRGNRVELSEIERVLQSLPGIDRAAVVVIQRQNQEPLLAAFVVAKSNASWSAPRLRHALGAILPQHMVPSRFTLLDWLPNTPGGKIDRQALRQLGAPVPADAKSGALRTETEISLADIWAEILELPAVGRDDDFFSLGGDSLAAAVVAAQVHAVFGVGLKLAAFIDYPTVATLAAFIDRSRRADAAATPPIAPVARAASMPLSLFQERIWKICRRREDGGTIPLARSYRITGPLDVDVLRACLAHLVDRHESLRTTFEVVDGEPAQIIHPSAPLDFSFVDLTAARDPEGEARALIENEASRPIHLNHLPILRFILVRIRGREHRLVRTLHPIIADGSSWGILLTELSVLYEAKLQGAEPPLPKHMPLQYADYAAWQREVLRPDGPLYRATVDWWKSQLSPATLPTRLPFRRLIRRGGLDPRDGTLQWKLDQRTDRQLDEFARSAGATYFIVRLAAFSALIADITANPAVVLGTNFVNRSRASTQNIVGLFANLSPIAFKFEPEMTFRNWVETVRNRVFETEMHCELPYEELCEKLAAAGVRPPQIRIIFAMTGEHAERRFADLTIGETFWPTATMPWGVSISLDEHAPDNCRIDFDAGLYDPKDVRAMLDRYLRLLEAAAQQPERPVGQLLHLSGAKPLRWTLSNRMNFIIDFLATRRRNASAPAPRPDAGA